MIVSWGTKIAEHDKTCMNCKCFDVQEEVLKHAETPEEMIELQDQVDKMLKVVRYDNTDHRTYDEVTSKDSGSPLFPAKWGGKCKNCDDKYTRGEDIGYIAGMEGPLCSYCHTQHDSWEVW